MQIYNFGSNITTHSRALSSFNHKNRLLGTKNLVIYPKTTDKFFCL